MTMPTIGQLIKNELKAQERTVTWFSRKLCIDRSNVYRLFQRHSIETELLMKISEVLDRDFFKLFSEKFDERRNSH